MIALRGLPQRGPRSAAGTLFACEAGTRAYRLHLPRGRSVRGLMVMLHGCTQTAEGFAALTGMSERAGAHGLAVLYPEQDDRANLLRCWNWFRPRHQMRGTGEPAILAEMIAVTAYELGLPDGRIALAGFSAGAAMAMVLRRTYPELFAGIAVHSGVATGTAADGPAARRAMRGQFDAPLPALPPIRPVPPPVLVLQGGADDVVHADNAARIAEEIGRDPGAGAGCRLVRAEAGAHHWFGGAGESASGIDATAEILAFARRAMAARTGILGRLTEVATGRLPAA
ncbi:extracellular catalytic domain type 1 short-chain-length polyhydroxyalkanoate depolymerase [Roseivivax sp. CAU 1761]